MSIPAFVVAASLLLVTIAVNLEVPLYKTYAQAAGYGNGLTAVVFAAYVAGLLPVLFLFGGSSDRLGRKAVILLGLVSALLATVLVVISPNIHTLFVARILQGMGVGLSLGAGTAYLAEILNDPTRAANYVGITTTLGLGSGSLLTSAALLYKNSLVPVSYWGVIAVTLLCIAFMMCLPDRQKAPAKRLLRLPYFPKGILRFGLAIAIAWSVTGIIIAILPAELASHQLTAWTGLVVFLSIGTGAFVQPLARRLTPERSLMVGYVLITLAYVFLLIGVGLGMISLVIAGSALAGATCFGFTYLGGLAAVTRAGGKEQARAVSGYFLFAYLGLGLPSILIGFLADLVGVLSALVGFGLVIIAANAWLGFRSKLSR
jgi:predicted MFS family arabinose efflux permease